MDLLFCEAPLDNSFQKERRELVNKGSIGRRRRPTRSNLKNLLSPEAPNKPFTSTSHSTSTTKISLGSADIRLTNGNGHIGKKISLPLKSSLKPVSSLPRTPSPQSQHVADAHQFSIEAKLKLKKLDSSRSSVLIQTWERRSRTDSFSKRQQQHSPQKTFNRFQNKENLHRNLSDMPGYTTQPRCTGTVQNGDSLKCGKAIREGYSRNNILNTMPVKSSFRVKPNLANGRTKATKHPEPEWISLSRKLRAKYVEVPVENHSTNSYSKEELEGVDHQQKTTVKVCPPQTTSELRKKVDQKKETVDIAPPHKTSPSCNSEPPWVPLSRKLCTKFIEEHIEYPFVPPVKKVTSKERDLNIEVRPIEKVGNSKTRKTKDEPEWVSLSRKLRAKFIESHKDDPDTISLENQLNASDPEETSSESLSDISQVSLVSAPTQEVTRKSATNTEWIPKNSGYAKEFGSYTKAPNPNRFQSKQSAPPSPDEEFDCWEFQEIESGHESDGGKPQGIECSAQFSNSKDTKRQFEDSNNNAVYSQENTNCRVSINSDPHKFTSFAETANAQMLQNAEYQNNDVQFSPYSENQGKPISSNSEKKGITIHFVSHRGHSDNSLNSASQAKQDRSPERINEQSPFFNLMTWEEAHFKSDEELNEISTSPSIATLKNELRSKSVENICEPEKNGIKANENGSSEDSGEHLSHVVKNTLHSKWNPIYKSEDFLDKLERQVLLNHVSKISAFNPKADSESESDFTHRHKDEPEEEANGTSKDFKRCNLKEKEKLSLNGIHCNVVDETNLNKSSFLNTNGKYIIQSKVENEILEQFNDLPLVEGEPFLSDENNVENVQVPTHIDGKDFIETTPVVIYFDRRNNSRKVYHQDSENSKSHYGVQTTSEDNAVKKDSDHVKDLEPTKNVINALNETETTTEKPKMTGMKKHYKCNGVIPNSKVNQTSQNTDEDLKREKVRSKSHSESQLCNQNKGNVQPSDRFGSTNEYANIPSVFMENGRNKNSLKSKCTSFLSVFAETSHHLLDKQEKDRRNSFEERPAILINGSNSKKMEDASTNTSLKIKSKSFNDISRNEDNSHESQSHNKANGSSKHSSPTTKFQELPYVENNPSCAKRISKQNGKLPSSTVSSASNRYPSPCSESSHVYEDMFKDKSSCPSDSETSSWTTMKNNSYYINGRSSSMNEIDFSDSCSMSVKCDYASSGSGHSTLQSRHSSCTSSSFYVNLRDYDSHMLEPRKKKDGRKTKSSSNLSNHSPPTPESLRHLFTSPFNSIHSPVNRTAQVLTRLSQETESHYYSTVTATSSAFKHGFDPTPVKPKKAERSSSLKIKDIAHGIILTFKKFQNHSKTSSTHYVDVSHLAETGLKSKTSEIGKFKPEKEKKKKHWGFSSESGVNDSDSGCQLSSKDVPSSKARRSSSDLTGSRPNIEILKGDLNLNGFEPDKKKTKNSKKKSSAKGKKKRSKSMDTRAVPTVSRKVQQLPDGTLYLVTTVSGDTAVPGVYSDSPDTSSELSSHRPVKLSGESNC